MYNRQESKYILGMVTPFYILPIYFSNNNLTCDKLKVITVAND